MDLVCALCRSLPSTQRRQKRIYGDKLPPERVVLERILSYKQLGLHSFVELRSHNAILCLTCQRQLLKVNKLEEDIKSAVEEINSKVNLLHYCGDSSGFIPHTDTMPSQWPSSFCRHTGEPSLLTNATSSATVFAPSASSQQLVNVYQPPELSTTLVIATSSSPTHLGLPELSDPVGPSELSAAPVGPSELSATPVRSSEISATPVRSSELSATPVRSSEISATPVRSSELSATPVRSSELSTASSSTRLGLSELSDPVGPSELSATPVRSLESTISNVTQIERRESSVANEPSPARSSRTFHTRSSPSISLLYEYKSGSKRVTVTPSRKKAMKSLGCRSYKAAATNIASGNKTKIYTVHSIALQIH